MRDRIREPLRVRDRDVDAIGDADAPPDGGLLALRQTVDEQAQDLDVLRAQLETLAAAQAELRRQLAAARDRLVGRERELRDHRARTSHATAELKEHVEWLEHLLAERTRERDWLRSVVQEQERALSDIEPLRDAAHRADAARAELQAHINAIERTRVWRLGQRYWRVRNRLTRLRWRAR